MSEELIKRLRGFWLSKDSGDTKIMRRLMTEAADALSRPAPAVQVPEGMVLVNRDDLDYMLGTVQRVAEAAYHRAGLVCCRVGGPECCGSPEPEWTPEDQEIMEALSPVVTGMSAMLAAAPAPATVATDFDGMYQDAAGTIPVTAIGQPVAQEPGIKDSLTTEAVAQRNHAWEVSGGKTKCRNCGAMLTSETEGTKCGVYPFEPVAQGGGVDVEKVMALVEEYGEQCEAAGYLDRSGSQDASKKLHDTAYQTAVKIRALLSASPAGVGVVREKLDTTYLGCTKQFKHGYAAACYEMERAAAPAATKKEEGHE